MEIRPVQESDRAFWFTLDQHLPKEQFDQKVREKLGYVLSVDGVAVGLMRYNFFWDEHPFCTMLYVAEEYQGRGYGRALMIFWEKEMQQRGYKMLMTSTQVDEQAQHFYRKLGYQDAGGLLISVPDYQQPMEMFFIKGI
ncbi:GNAT family N-acetyltransferase [Candidatus Enterococcus murrayae]|uniref:GNAT family N-acetyltransferase n=1 Tax=Candidatus Enterococcus murrayae TaxID=2815321 RepID=A0ABS3HFT3_9ENTE|nr:GNAT family N-acetyltransferase [Enterococcus sp. MJM16]MBO0452305.1 GNAT family N-acetyltransferase [Enterococcus sp. MJM16]